MRILLLTLLLCVMPASMTTPILTAGASCGLKPIKPLKPYGCKDLVARCICDDRGRNCVWVWDCVPN